jgi:hypothetical protein
MAEWIFEVFDLETVGKDMISVAEKRKHRGKVLRLLTVCFILFSGAGYWLKGYLNGEENKKLDEVNHQLVAARETDKATMNSVLGENTKLQRQHSDDQAKIQAAEQDRNRYQTDWLILSSSHSSNSLVNVVTNTITNIVVTIETNTVTITNTNTVTGISYTSVPQDTRRILSPEALGRIQDILKVTPHVPIGIEYPLGDAEAGRLSEQLRTLFEKNGFTIAGYSQVVWNKPVTGLLIRSKAPPSGPIAFGLMQIFKELNARPVLFLGDDVPDNEVMIVVGSNDR